MEKKIILKAMADDDLTLLKKWLYQPHVADWFEQPESWIHEVERRHDEFVWVHHFIAEYEGKPAGFCQFYEYKRSGEDWQGTVEVEGTYSLDYLLGEASLRGMGLGRAIICQLLQEIKGQPGAKRVIAHPDPENKASCGTLLSCGFGFDQENKIYVIQFS